MVRGISLHFSSRAEFVAYDERGSVVAIVAIAIVGLFSMVALCIDSGFLFDRGLQLQYALDSAAYHAASQLHSDQTLTDEQVSEMVSEVTYSHLQLMNLDLGSVDSIDVDIVRGAGIEVRVGAALRQDYWFAGVIPGVGDSILVRARTSVGFDQYQVEARENSDVILVVDTSLSMNKVWTGGVVTYLDSSLVPRSSNKKSAAAVAATQNLIAGLDGKLTVIAFNRGCSVVLPPTIISDGAVDSEDEAIRSRQAATQRVNELFDLELGTNINCGLSLAAHILDEYQNPERVAVVVVTDGKMTRGDWALPSQTGGTDYGFLIPSETQTCNRQKKKSLALLSANYLRQEGATVHAIGIGGSGAGCGAFCRLDPGFLRAIAAEDESTESVRCTRDSSVGFPPTEPHGNMYTSTSVAELFEHFSGETSVQKGALRRFPPREGGDE